MKLLAPDEGWVLQEGRLFWTTDNGKNWKDITPHDFSSQEIASVFFLDTSTGWVLFAVRNASNDVSGFDLASTATAGENWTITHINIPDFDPNILLGSYGQVDFVDSIHGWANLSVVGSSAFNPGFTLKTADGGRTWSYVSGGLKIGAGSVRFVDANEGWATDGKKLYVTHDGGNSWQGVSLKAPPRVQSAVYPTYELPSFTDSQQGFLAVTYSRPGFKSTMVLFATKDGGYNWRFDRLLPDLKETSVGQPPLPNTIADSSWIIAVRPSFNHHLILTRVGPEGSTANTTGMFAARNNFGTFDIPGISSLSFTSASNGWALIACCGSETNLLSTTDGGATWANITPGNPGTDGMFPDFPAFQGVIYGTVAVDNGSVGKERRPMPTAPYALLFFSRTRSR